MGAVSRIKVGLSEVLNAYASVLFLQSQLAGLVLLLGTCLLPNVGMCGVLGVLLGMVVSRGLGFASDSDGLYLANPLLIGLALGAFYQMNSALLLLLSVAVLATVMLNVLLVNVLWSRLRLPAMSLSFVMVAFSTYVAARNYGNLTRYLPDPVHVSGWDLGAIGRYLQTLGAIFFTPHMLAGVLVFFCIFFSSRYLAFLALSGYVVGVGCFQWLMGPLPEYWVVWSSFNFSLAAMVVGGILTVPGISSYAVALVSVLLSALVTSMLFTLLASTGLPVMALPFLTATLLLCAALRLRNYSVPPWFAEPPGMPETNYERARLARFRNGDVSSVGVMAPFLGEWNVYQGMNGRHTHQGPWRYALDFYITRTVAGGEPKSYQNTGNKLEDYYCFGQPVVSPVYGEVIRCSDQLADNAPGEMDAEHNWGNFIVIDVGAGRYVMLAHLRQKSLLVKERQRVSPGDVLAACGNSGRSPQPHLHLQVQQGPQLNSATVPFHLCSVLVASSGATHYRLVSVPGTGQRIEPAVETPHLAVPLHLPVGRELQYRWRSGGEEVLRKLAVTVTLLGQYRLVSDSGASAAFAEANGVLAFYDRTGPKDSFLDAWLLAVGLTPLSDLADVWRDSPGAGLVSMNILQRLWMGCRYPLGCGLRSLYCRTWDETLQCWRQTSTHHLPMPSVSFFKLLNLPERVECQALLNPVVGCYEFRISAATHAGVARLDALGLVADEGIPGWQMPASGAVDASAPGEFAAVGETAHG